mgnify:CR=1 FL=1
MKLVGVSGANVGKKTSKAVQELLLAVNSLDSSIQTELVDLKDFEVEMVNGQPLSMYNEDTIEVVNTILSADFLVFGTPVYQASIPGVLKNLLDHLPTDAFKQKVTGIVSTAGSDKHFLSFLKGVIPATGVFIQSDCFNKENEIEDSDLLIRIRQLAEEMILLQRTLTDRAGEVN